MDEKDRLIDRIEGHERAFMRLLARDSADGIFSVNLTMRQIKVMMLLDLEASLSMHELAGRLGVGLATTTGIVDRLVAQDIAVRREDPDDRRIRRIELSAHGHDVIDQFRDFGRERKRRVLRRLEPDQLTDFARLMEALAAAMEAELDAAEAEHADTTAAAE